MRWWSLALSAVVVSVAAAAEVGRWRGDRCESAGGEGARYVAQAGRGQNPVTQTSFFDAMRFTNWLHSGLGSGETESGAYTIGSGVNDVRSAGAKFWITSEDECYKATYHDATAGTAGVYFDYATGSDSVRIVVTADSVGDISNPGVGVANDDFGAE